VEYSCLSLLLKEYLFSLQNLYCIYCVSTLYDLLHVLSKEFQSSIDVWFFFARPYVFMFRYDISRSSLSFKEFKTLCITICCLNKEF